MLHVNLLEMHVSPQGLLVVPQCLQQAPPPPAGAVGSGRRVGTGVHVAGARVIVGVDVLLAAVGAAKRVGVKV